MFANGGSKIWNHAWKMHDINLAPSAPKAFGVTSTTKEIQTKAATPKVSVGGSARKMCFVQPVHEFSNCTLVKPNLLKNGQMGLNGLLQRENHPTISYSIWATICSYYLLDNILNYLIIFKTFQNSKHQHTIMFLKNPLEPESCSSQLWHSASILQHLFLAFSQHLTAP